MRALNVTSALYGLHYDFGTQLQKQNTPENTLSWLEERITKLRRDIHYYEQTKAKQRVGGIKV